MPWDLDDVDGVSVVVVVGDVIACCCWLWGCGVVFRRARSPGVVCCCCYWCCCSCQCPGCCSQVSHPAQQLQFPWICLFRWFWFRFSSFSFLPFCFSFSSSSSCSSCCSSSLGWWTFGTVSSQSRDRLDRQRGRERETVSKLFVWWTCCQRHQWRLTGQWCPWMKIWLWAMSTLFQARAKLSWSVAEAFVPENKQKRHCCKINLKTINGCRTDAALTHDEVVPFSRAVRIDISMSCCPSEPILNTVIYTHTHVSLLWGSTAHVNT